MKQFIKLFPMLFGLLILPGCTTHYKKRSLSYLQQAPLDYKETKENITLEIKKLDKAHTKPLFDGQGKYLLNIGAQPLHLRIINDSNCTYYLYPESISLARIDNEKIGIALSRGMSPVLGSLAQGLVPISLFGLMIFDISRTGLNAVTLFIFGPAIIVIGAVAIISLPFIIGSTIYSCYQKNNEINEYNQSLSEDIAEKNIPDSLKIPADTTQEFLFFADATQFKNNFDVTCTEKITQKPLTFNVTL